MFVDIEPRSFQTQQKSVMLVECESEQRALLNSSLPDDFVSFMLGIVFRGKGNISEAERAAYPDNVDVFFQSKAPYV